MLAAKNALQGTQVNGLGRLWLGCEPVGVARLEGTQRALSETKDQAKGSITALPVLREADNMASLGSAGACCRVRRPSSVA